MYLFLFECNLFNFTYLNNRHYALKTVLATVTSNELVSQSPANKIYSLDLHYVIDDATSYEAGDNVAVLAPNDVSSPLSFFLPHSSYYLFSSSSLLFFDVGKVEVVESLLARLGLVKDRVFNIEQEIGQSDICCSLGRNRCTPELALTYFYGSLYSFSFSDSSSLLIVL